MSSLDSFLWPTNHDEANAWLIDFMENKLDDFASYDASLDGPAPPSAYWLKA